MTRADSTSLEEVPASFREMGGSVAHPASNASSERVVVARRQAAPGFESWQVQNTKRLWTVFHTTYAFCAVRSVRDHEVQAWRYRRRRFEADRASVMMIEPGELHVTLNIPLSDFDVLLLDPSWLVDPELNLQVHFKTGQFQDSRIAAGLLRLSRQFSEGAEDLEVQESWCELRRQLIENAGEHYPVSPGICSRAVQRAREHLHDCFMREVTLDDVARAAEASKFHLDRSFREQMGIPMHRYLTKVRLAHAERLLRTGAPVHSVAEATGFADAPHLTRVFRKSLGMTPGRYARACRGR